jgi:hypothetical protein
MNDYNRQGRPASRRMSFELPEGAVNLYLRWALKLKPRPGIKNLGVTFLAGNRIQVTSEIDFDEVRTADQAVASDKLLKTMTGIRAVAAELVFSWKDCNLAIEVVPLSSSRPLPPSQLQKLLHAVAKMQPEQIDTEVPIPAPYGLFLSTRPKLLVGTTAAPTGKRCLSKTSPRYDGHLDRAGCSRLQGWAWDSTIPTEPVEVGVFVQGNAKPIHTVPASLPRADLSAAGIGDGMHAFDFATPAGLLDGKPHFLSLRIVETGFELKNSPLRLVCPPESPHP